MDLANPTCKPSATGWSTACKAWVLMQVAVVDRAWPVTNQVH